MLQEYQPVALNIDRRVAELDGEPVVLRRGARGVIMLIHDIPGLPIGYSVEFFDDNHNTIAIDALEEKYLIPLGPPPPLPGEKKKKGKVA